MKKQSDIEVIKVREKLIGVLTYHHTQVLPIARRGRLHILHLFIQHQQRKKKEAKIMSGMKIEEV